MAIANLNKGKNLSASALELIKQAALDRKPLSFSIKAVKNMKKKKSKAILVYNLDYNFYGEFTSIVDAAKSLGCDPKTIKRALQATKKKS